MRRPRHGRPGIIIPILIVAVAALCACRAPSPEPSSGGTVRMALSTEPETLSLIGKTDRYSEVIARQITDSLIQFDTDLAYRPSLAESWEISPDGLEITFRLRPGVRWHDGEPFTADDVLFTVGKVREPETRAISYLSQFEDLVELEAPDDLSVRAVYSEPYADFLEAWTVPIVPRHLVEKDEDLFNGEFSRNPVGCGPFRFVSREPGRKVVLEANESYWDGRPPLDRLVFQVIADERTGYQAMLSGDLDIMSQTPDIWRESRDEPRARDLVRLKFERLNVWYIAWNQKGNPFFSDYRVRRAMIHALDRETFIDRALDGLGIPGATTYHPNSSWTDPEVRPWPYDPQEAARLLAAAGWNDGDGDGVLDRDGEPFRFTMLIPRATQEIVDRIAAWTQQSLAEIGVAMEIEFLEWRAFRERRNDRRFQAAMASLTFSPIPDQYELYHSSAAVGGYNFFGLVDPEIDRLLERGRTTFDTARRKEIYHRLQRRLHELEPLTCMFHFSVPVLHRREIRGIQPSPIDFYRTWPGPRAWSWAGESSGEE